VNDDTIAANLRVVRERIVRACERSGRPPDDVTVIAVSKTHNADAIAAAWRAGVRDFGENRVQEAASKIGVLRAEGVRPTWHLVGHLQTNKAADSIDLFDILHSVDSERLVLAISGRATRPVRVLLEVNVAGEQSKFGVAPEAALALAGRIGGIPNINLAGLMTVAPQADDPEGVRPIFRTLRQLAEAAGLRELSMGMTDDFEVAVEEGATLVRVGRAIFGPRAG
jgi:pyridoxal phosphate enzyme (YggS family)